MSKVDAYLEELDMVVVTEQGQLLSILVLKPMCNIK
jgi:hypothetical protein